MAELIRPVLPPPCRSRAPAAPFKLDATPQWNDRRPKPTEAFLRLGHIDLSARAHHRHTPNPRRTGPRSDTPQNHTTASDGKQIMAHTPHTVLSTLPATRSQARSPPPGRLTTAPANIRDQLIWGLPTTLVRRPRPHPPPAPHTQHPQSPPES